ncbi:MAG: DUF3309 family protein [Isosphaeraceae bacterium]
MGLLSLIVLVALVWGSLSRWGYGRSWGYGADGMKLAYVSIRQPFSKE